MRLTAIIFLAFLFLLAKLPPILAVPLALAILVLTVAFVYSLILGAWRLIYYGGRNQRDRAKL